MSFFSYNDNIIIYLSQSLFYNILYINHLSGYNNVSIDTLYTIFNGFKVNNFSSLLNIISKEYQSLINYFVNFMTFIIPPEGITLLQFYDGKNPSNPTSGIINILNVIQPQFTMLIEYITSISTIGERINCAPANIAAFAVSASNTVPAPITILSPNLPATSLIASCSAGVKSLIRLLFAKLFI
jgi:hypothetical protein